MRLSRLLVVVATLATTSAPFAFAGCGGSNGGSGNGDGGEGDGTVEGSTDGPSGSDGKTDGTAGNNDGSTKDGGTGNKDGGKVSDAGAPSDAALMPDAIFAGDGGCITLGNSCSSSAECCGGDCSGGVCVFPPCGSTGSGCTTNGQCCSLTCGTNGTCSSINGGVCGTLGNGCTMDGQCCSGRCANGACQPSSWCAQTNDICASGADCCSGVCTVPTGQTVGTCGLPNITGNCSQVDGMLCTPTSTGDGGTCGGACCSRLCAPWGATGISVCQPATGCHVFNDTCKVDGDCCGSAALIEAGAPGPQNGGVATCVGGYCTYPGSCAPNGDVCKLMTMSCTAHQDCCAGNGNKNTACRADNVGVPRCASGCDPDAGLGTGGSACSTSADCCNGDPCVPNPHGTPPYICANTTCVPSCSTCSTSADCCPGLSCINGTCDPCGGSVPDGGTPGDAGTTMGSDAGMTSCSQLGQLCGGDGGLSCCTGLHCIGGRCELQ